MSYRGVSVHQTVQTSDGQNSTVGSSLYPRWPDSQPYVWDGKERPNIDNYLKPWQYLASQTKYKYTFDDRKKYHNAMITYAQNQMMAAQAQYDNDLAFWNERDERNYTSQLAQRERYEDAGFNLGYLYNQVDNGNSSVGYNQESSQFEPTENEGDEFGGFKIVFDAVTTALSIGTKIIQAGISLKKLPAELALLAEQRLATRYQALASSALSVLYGEKSRFQELQNELREFIQYHDKDGNSVENLGNSLAVAMEQLSYRIKSQEETDLINWNQVSKQIYKLQSTPSASQAYNDWIMEQNMPDWCKVICIVLGSAVSQVVPSTGIRKTIK